MTAPKPTTLPPLAAYVLSAATPDQYTLSLTRQFLEWGIGLTFAQYREREELLSASAFGSRLRCWVLVPSDDLASLDFPCYCETYRRPILLSGLDGPIRTTGYSIASVFTHAPFRKRGFAGRMMSLLHAELGVSIDTKLEDLNHEDTVEAAWKGGSDGALSFLYSDVGSFYASCLPEEGDGTGWEIRAPLQTTWDVNFYVPSTSTSTTSTTFTPVSLADLPSLVAQDVACLLASFTPDSPKSFIVEPTVDNYVWAMTRSQFYLSPGVGLSRSFSAPRCWGFQSAPKTGSDDGEFILFVPHYVKKSLKILRLRGSARGESEKDLIDLAVKVAKECGLEKVTAWNCGVDQGERAERRDSLSAVKVYGRCKEVEWRINEDYAWC